MTDELRSRRQFLRDSAGAAAYLAATGISPPKSATAQQPPEMLETVIPWDDAGARSESLPSTARFYDLSRVTSNREWLTPTESFFVLSHHEVPSIDTPSFRLVFSGLFETPTQVSLDELRRRERVSVTACMECAGNGGVGMHGLVGNVEWTGVRLGPLLRELGLRSGTRDVVFFGADRASERVRANSYPSRFARSLAPDDAVGDDVIVAFEMNGRPLPVEHGYPLRLIVPGWYGVAQVKWLSEIRAIDRRFMGWYMAKDYVTVRGESTGTVPGTIEHHATSVGPMRPKSILNRVGRLSPHDGGDADIWIYGIAWGNQTPWRSVSIAIDGGDYRSAEWWGPRSRYGWSLFRARWEAPSPGPHRLTSRVSDELGSQPSAERAERFKATPWENNGQIERRITLPAAPG